jgi:hypothetical protein
MTNRSGLSLDVQHSTVDNVHPTTTVLESFPAGAPRGSWPAEEFAAARRLEGIPAHVVMNLATDTFNVVVKVEAA